MAARRKKSDPAAETPEQAVVPREQAEQSTEAAEAAAPAAPGTDPEPGSAAAAGDTDVSSAPHVEQIVMFYLGGQRYGLPIDRVQEIQQIVALTEVPEVAPAVVGMVNLRGDVIPAIDLRVLIGLKRAAYGLQTPMVICRTAGRLVALIVDEVEDVVEPPEGCMQEPSALHALADRLIGVCRMEGALVFVLDIDRLVSAEAVAATEGGEG